MAESSAGTAGEAEDAFASLNSVILTSSLLALVAIGYSINTHRLRHLPESGAAIAIGFVVGAAVRLLRFKEEEELLNFRGEFFFFVLLPPIIFEAGLSLKMQMFVDNLGAILAFAVLGTVVSTWVTSVSLRWAAEAGLVGLVRGPRLAIYCHLFGALISATDAVATIALFGGTRFRADPLLHSLVNGESVLNDAVAIVLFTTLTHHMDEEEPQLISASVLGHFLLVSVGSLAVGLLAGAACSWCFCHSRLLARFPHYEISAMCLGAYLTFALSQLLGLSGITALFFFGVVLAQYNWYNLSEPSKIASKVTFGTLAKLAESCVFVYLGVVAALSLGRFHWHLGLVFFALVVVVLARAAHVFPLAAVLNLGRDRQIDRNMSVCLWASGLRGAIAFALSLRVPCAGPTVRRGSPECRDSDLLVTTTISIVVLTTLVLGTAMERMMTSLGVIEPALPSGMDCELTSPSSLSVPLASRVGSGEPSGHGEARQQCPVSGQPEGFMPLAGDAPLSGERRDGSPGTGPEVRRTSSVRSLLALRFNARGRLYQAFALFDLNVLQPALGGPCRVRVRDAVAEAVELPSAPGFSALFPPPSEEDAPTWSRSVVFE